MEKKLRKMIGEKMKKKKIDLWDANRSCGQF